MTDNEPSNAAGGGTVEAVQFTSDDAAISKFSASKLGYFQDDFLQYFVPPQAVTQRAPLINRGWRRFEEADSQPWSRPGYHVFPTEDFEVDFPVGVKKKAEIIASAKPLLELMHHKQQGSGDSKDAKTAPAKQPAAAGGGEFAVPEIRNPIAARMLGRGQSSTSSHDFHMVGADLRDVAELEKKLTAAGMDFSLPTLVLSECVLVYIKPEHSAAVIQWCAKKLTGGGVFVTYEQIHPNDPFGKTMMRNLAQRGCHLLGLERYPDLPSQRERFISLGWTRHAAWDMNDVYKFFIPREEIRRIERLELFDEFEEWNLINAHYCISMAALDAKQQPQPQQQQQALDLSSIGLIGRQKLAPKDSDKPLDVTAVRAKFMKNPAPPPKFVSGAAASGGAGAGGGGSSMMLDRKDAHPAAAAGTGRAAAGTAAASSDVSMHTGPAAGGGGGGGGDSGDMGPPGKRVPKERKPGERRWDDADMAPKQD